MFSASGKVGDTCAGMARVCESLTLASRASPQHLPVPILDFKNDKKGSLKLQVRYTSPLVICVRKITGTAVPLTGLLGGRGLCPT